MTAMTAHDQDGRAGGHGAGAGETIHVCPLSAVEGMIARAGARHLVTLINRESMIDTPPPIPPENHLRLAINDVTTPFAAAPGLVPPQPDHIAEILDFAMAWDRRTPMLVHCWAGISRSTACAFIMLCALNPSAPERRIAEALRSASETATPNPLMIDIADDLLDRKGRMVSAIRAIGPGARAFEGEAFALPARFDG